MSTSPSQKIIPYKRFAILLRTLVLVGLVAAVKYAAHQNGLEIMQVNSLFTSVISGGIFIMGVILAGTMTDYKESERLPAEIVASVDNIYDEGKYIYAVYPKFNQTKLADTIKHFLQSFQSDIRTDRMVQSAHDLEKIYESILEMEYLKVPANYLVRLKSEVGLVKKNVLRIEHIQRTSFMPSAYVLFETLGLSIIALLVVTKIDPFLSNMATTAIISYVFIYTNRLLRIMDKPFIKHGKSVDTVSLFLVREFEERITAETKE